MPVLKVDGLDVTDDSQWAECFSRVFDSKLSDPIAVRLPDVLPYYDIDALSEFSVTHDTVFNLLKTQNVHKACAVDQTG